jgi:4,5-dihydroxyphthalate decarboxylase
MDLKLPEGVTQPPGGKSLTDMLLADELDAIYSPPRPEQYHPVNGPLARLFPDFRPVEEAYFRATGAFPPQHLIVIRRTAWEANPWIAKSLTDAFAEAEAVFNASIRGFPYATPWLEEELERTTSLMGTDFHPVGFEPNRAQVKIFADEAHRMGFTTKAVTPEDYFQEFLAG